MLMETHDKEKKACHFHLIIKKLKPDIAVIKMNAGNIKELERYFFRLIRIQNARQCWHFLSKATDNSAFNLK